jgi:polysaccharide biosynthesis/export protein VpsN
MNRKSIFILLCALIMPLMSAWGQNDTIRAGQAIQLNINGVPAEEKSKFDGIYPVSSSGMINLPHLGLIRAAGLRSDQLAVSIQNAYKSRQLYTNPTVQVLVSSDQVLTEQILTVGGQVNRQGPVKYASGMTLYQAVAAAGGATPFGSMKRVKLYRAGKMTQYDLTKGQFMQVPVQPNDTIEVPQKTPWGG